MDKLNSKYKELNASYPKSLIFHLGYNAGFFAEYTCMVNAMLFCLENKIEFKLYSEDANFGAGKGWNDYFIPFCEEVHEKFNHKYNFHRIPSWKVIIKASINEKTFKNIIWKAKFSCYHMASKLLCLYHYKKKTLLTQDITFNAHKYYKFPELGIEGEYIEVFNKISDMIWNFNEYTNNVLQEALKELNLPDKYASCQIRGGDKITEAQLISEEHYINKIKELGHRNVFLLTDDYNIFKRLEETCTSICWSTLCDPNDTGYDNKKFCSSDKDFKRNKIAKLLSSVQILMNSDTFIGSITCGPSLFMLKHKYPSGIAIDCKPEKLKESISLNIQERAVIVNQYLNNLKQKQDR